MADVTPIPARPILLLIAVIYLIAFAAAWAFIVLINA